MRWLRFYTSWTFLVGWSWIFGVATGDLVIIRKVNKKDVYHKDRFNIRRSKCTDIRQGNKCGFYGGFERSTNNPCKCHCPPRRGTIIKRKMRWRCISNEVLRQQQGCGIYLLYEASDSFVKILSGKNWHSFHAAASRCTVKQKKASYLSCNGTWTIDPNIGQFVDFLRRGFDQVARGYAYQIRIRSNQILEGKLLKLHLDCAAFGGYPCLLVKMKGKQNCFNRSTSSNQIQLRKNFKKNAPLLASSPGTNVVAVHQSMNSTLSSSIPFTTNLTKTQGSTLKKIDMEVTTIILTITALLLGLVVLGLAVNLCCSSTGQESFKGKHIFQRVKNHRSIGAQRLRTCSDVTTTSHSLSMKDGVSSSDKLKSSFQTLHNPYYCSSCGCSSTSITRQEGVS